MAHSAISVTTLAAQGFREQKPRRAVHVQRRGMELDELDVADLSAGAPSHRDAVASSHFRIGGLAVNASQSTSGEQHRPSGNGREALAARIVYHRARYAAVFH